MRRVKIHEKEGESCGSFGFNGRACRGLIPINTVRDNHASPVAKDTIALEKDAPRFVQ